MSNIENKYKRYKRWSERNYDTHGQATCILAREISTKNTGLELKSK